MKILLIKTSSLGDLLHTFPAISDAATVYPDLQIDWVVEEAFADIPLWHPNVRNVIPVAIRRWRKHPVKAWRSGEIATFKRRIAEGVYDYIIDAQGLLKSAWIGRCNAAPYIGLDKHSIREPIASWFYQHRYSVAKGIHAVQRNRLLFAAALKYAFDENQLHFGVQREQFLHAGETAHPPYVMFFHGTTWESKHWPETYWNELAQLIRQQGWQVKLPWSNAAEYERAQRIQAQMVDDCEILPKMSLQSLVSLIAGAKGAISVDSGLGHIATALNVPTLGLYGPTSATLTGIKGPQQQSLSADYACAPCLKKQCPLKPVDGIMPPCFTRLHPNTIWHYFLALLPDDGLDSKK